MRILFWRGVVFVTLIKKGKEHGIVLYLSFQ